MVRDTVQDVARVGHEVGLAAWLGQGHTTPRSSSSVTVDNREPIRRMSRSPWNFVTAIL